ncbi:MAG: GNAT family N-acetyltransferase [Candidatus Hermodarchaeota archaeon]
MNDKKKEVTTPFLEGEIVNLCPLNMENVNLYTKWFNDPDIRRYSRNIIPWSIDEIKKWSEPEGERVKKEIVFEIWHRKDNKAIGTAGFSIINWFNRNANLFVAIGESNYWGQKIAPEVSKILINYGFEELNFHKIYTSIYSPNKQSLRVAEKIGFKHEGTLKEQIYIDGVFVDELKFAIFKNQWLNYDR